MADVGARPAGARAPAGGWARGADSHREHLRLQATLVEQARAAAPHVDALVASPEGRRRASPWPSASARFRHDWLPHADWVVLDGVGHCPQLDVPLEAAQLILGFTSG